MGVIEGFSGPFANAGAAVWRNLQFAVARINQRGGVRVGAIRRPLQLVQLDSKGQTEEALNQLLETPEYEEIVQQLSRLADVVNANRIIGIASEKASVFLTTLLKTQNVS